MGLIGFLMTVLLSTAVVGVAWVIIDVAQDSAPAGVAQSTVSDTSESLSPFRPGVNIADLWYYVIGFVLLIIIAVAYRLAMIGRDGSEAG